jgi:1,4-alpha-glucan branching enzyme
LLLLQSSDWPFLVTTLQAKEYAIERFQEHLGRFDQLASLAEAEVLAAADEAFVTALRERDNPFPRIDYREWAPRQGYAGAVPSASAAS